MTDDTQTNETNTQGKEDNKSNEESNKPVNIVDEARAIRDEIKAEREKLEKANAEAKQIQAEQMLSGTSGGHVETKPAEEESATDYAKKVMSGGLNGKATGTEE